MLIIVSRLSFNLHEGSRLETRDSRALLGGLHDDSEDYLKAIIIRYSDTHGSLFEITQYYIPEIYNWM